ncbi:MAG: flagellar export chaperone FliS [Candidatus Nanopelagicales bacterium]
MSTALKGAGVAAYTSHSRSTASPARLVVMVYDRLLLDLDRAEQSLRSSEQAHEHLLHAQEIIMELLTALDVTAWEGARQLSGIYTFLYRELVEANIRRDPDSVASCRALVEPLRDAWAQAILAPAEPGLRSSHHPSATAIA